MFPFLKDNQEQEPTLRGREGLAMLRAMSATEALEFVRRAADIAEQTDNLSRGLREALRERKGALRRWRWGK